MEQIDRHPEESPERSESEHDGGLTPNRTTPGGTGVTSGNAATSATDPVGYGGPATPQAPVDPHDDDPERAR